MNPQTTVRILDIDNAPELVDTCTLAQFLEDNDFDAATRDEVVRALEVAGSWHCGGGAAPLFRVEVAR